MNDLDLDLRTPSKVDDLGIRRKVFEDLVLRRLVADGRTPIPALAQQICVSPTLLEPVLSQMRDRGWVSYPGMAGHSFEVEATDEGRTISATHSTDCHYAGPTPVSIEAYTKIVLAQHTAIELDRATLRRAFQDMLVPDDLLDKLGPAIHGSGAIFLYGPPGTGKTSLAVRVVRAHRDSVLLPHTVEVLGNIIAVFDPVLHEPLDEQPAGLDPRWIACRAPAIVAGGELTADMLDLRYDADSGIFQAPLQMKANNGVFVVDDFGRQAMSPDALLNRWIVPLDRGIDYLTLRSLKIEIPFEVKVVLSTNLGPSELGDEAFFRRIHHKIYVGAASNEQFAFVLDRASARGGITVAQGALARLRDQARERGDGELRAYLPVVICQIAKSITAYENLPPTLTPAIIDRALDLYFSSDPDGDAGFDSEPGPDFERADFEPSPVGVN